MIIIGKISFTAWLKRKEVLFFIKAEKDNKINIKSKKLKLTPEFSFNVLEKMSTKSKVDFKYVEGL